MPKINVDKSLILPIGEAAKMLDVSISTLRRLDERGIIGSIRNIINGKRFFFKTDLINLKYDDYKLAREWVRTDYQPNIKKFKEFYYPDESRLNGKVSIEARQLLEGIASDEYIGVIISATMELVGNVFYHNQGQWPDVEGAFYVLDRTSRRIIVADRGVGLLKNLKLVRKNLNTHAEAIKIAFTEQLSSRGTDGHRGYGLKHVRNCIAVLKRLIYQTGNARLEIRSGDSKLYINEISVPIQGCMAIIEF